MKIGIFAVLLTVFYLGCSNVINVSNHEDACQTELGSDHLPDRFEFLCAAQDARVVLFEPSTPKILILGASWCGPCRLVLRSWLENQQVPIGWKLVFFEDLSRYGENPDSEYDTLARSFIPKYWEMLPACAVITYKKIGENRYRAIVEAKFSGTFGCTKGVVDWIRKHPVRK